MNYKRKIKVLVVDDSMFFREVLSRGLATDPLIEVIAVAKDPFDARDKILEFEPDVMTCDVEMPKMNGIEFIRKLIPQYPMPVIVISTISEAVFDAMKAGAVDFVTKPNLQSVSSVEEFIYDIIHKVRIAANAKVLSSNHDQNLNNFGSLEKIDRDKIIAIGASTGGTEAIYSVLKSMPENIPGIVIVQHIPPVFSKMFAHRMNTALRLEVKEAVSGDLVEQGKVLIAPGDQHIKIRKVGDQYKIICIKGEKVNGHCPSVDVLFDSVAKEAGGKAVGIILTGMGYDGAKGLLSMRRKGARTIGQDADSSVVYGMPKVAYEIGAVEKQTSLSAIPQVLYSMLK